MAHVTYSDVPSMAELIRPPKSVARKLQELRELCNAHPDYLSVGDVAKFTGTKPDGIRNSIELGNCPFGFCWQLNQGGNKAFKIPTVTFYLWYTQQTGMIWKEAAEDGKPA